MEQSATGNNVSALQAYLEHRGMQNARNRWLFAALLLVVALAYILTYLVQQRVLHDGTLSLHERYFGVFCYLVAISLAALAAGRKPLPLAAQTRCRLDNLWILLVLCGAAALATFDSGASDPSALVLIAVPVAVLHSAERAQLLALQGAMLLLTLCGVAFSGYLSGPNLHIHLVTVTVVAVAAAYLAVHLEQARRREFMSTFALASSNRELRERSAELARLNTALGERSAALEEANRQLERLAMTDPLTGVANRRQLFEALDREFGRSRRYGNALSIALIDLDDFGQANKIHGVIAGDEVLAQFAGAIRGELRGVDMVARYGGEEFVVVMPDSGLAAAMQLLERMREFISRTPLSSRHIALTFSAGVATLTPEDADPINLLHRADLALRQAKKEGKNRVLAG